MTRIIYDMSEDTRIRELARMREKALHDEASALRQAKDEGKSEGVAMVIEKMRASGMTEEQINAILSLN